MPRRPRFAGQALVETKPHLLAHRAKFAERPVQPVQELKLRAVFGWDPDLCNANEGLHHGLRLRDRRSSAPHGPGENFASSSLLHLRLLLPSHAIYIDRHPDLPVVAEGHRIDLKTGAFAMQPLPGPQVVAALVER